MSGYLPDDFDRLDEADLERAGAHRAGPSPALAVVPLLLVALLVVAVVVGAITAVRSGEGTSTATTGGTAAPTSSPATSSPATSAPATSAPATSAPATTTTTPTASAATPSAPPDRSPRLTVLNGTRTAGLAGDVAALLGEAGWDDVGTGNFREDDVPPTTVFYGPTQDLPVARLAARDLGGLPVAQDADIADDGVTVLVSEDYES